MNSAQFVKYYVNNRIQSIIENDHKSKAILAELRRGIGKKPGENPKLWEITLANIPEEYYSKYGEPTYVEWAIYISLTLFAFHQQGNSLETKLMHHRDVNIGAALAQLVKEDEDESRIKRYLDRLVTASDVIEMARHLRSAVSLLKGEKIGLDYAGLAVDIFRFNFIEGKQSVSLLWAQSFYSQLYKSQNQKKSNKGEK
ncbi:MAG: type I-E CRISPR-associated protein Cse2/CasB [Eubacteriaceae bacterium]|jgi:CRISPR system Cascade subunit CasB|nr:type I-E CRISPR-associated protein Cse2/CasB [Eubacteriaceae bacterium]